MEKGYRESLVTSCNAFNKKYSVQSNYEFDYEINYYKENGNIDENESFCDELVPRFYKCEPIKFYRKNWIKGIVSKNKIRLINKRYDLDMMYKYKLLNF